MNDKCAGGTGAVIDKISMKLGIPLENLCKLRYSGIRLHPVAGIIGPVAPPRKAARLLEDQDAGKDLSDLVEELLAKWISDNANV